MDFSRFHDELSSTRRLLESMEQQIRARTLDTSTVLDAIERLNLTDDILVNLQHYFATERPQRAESTQGLRSALSGHRIQLHVYREVTDVARAKEAGRSRRSLKSVRTDAEVRAEVEDETVRSGRVLAGRLRSAERWLTGTADLRSTGPRDITHGRWISDELAE